MGYKMTCTCGDVMKVEANSREEAVEKLKEMTTEESLKMHMAEKHPGEAVPTLEQSHLMVEKTTTAA